MNSRRQFLSGLGSLALAKVFLSPSSARAATWKKLTGTGSGVPPKVYSWGFSSNLGAGALPHQSTPVVVCCLSNVMAVTMGYSHAAALLPSGEVMAWGANTAGQVGNNTTSTYTTPVAVCVISTAVGIAAGCSHVLALLSNGTVMAWGCGSGSQLGNNSTANQCTPVFVCGISTAKAVATGSVHSLALLNNGTVMAWGTGGTGRLGNNANTNRATPVAVCDITNAIAIAAGDTTSFALLANGRLMSWGSGTSLGDDMGAGKSRPVNVCVITNAAAIAAGLFHALALLSTGQVMAWGCPTVGQIGNGDTASPAYTPVPVCSITNAVAIGAGGSHSLALLMDGTLMSWGCGATGQLGNNATANVATPVPVCLPTQNLKPVISAKNAVRRQQIIAGGVISSIFIS